MKMRPLVSSTIKSIGFDEETSKMRVEFNSGTTYEYSNVTRKEYDDLSTGKLSTGKNVMALIKHKSYIKL